MTFSFIILGVLIIMVIFNVGESVYKKINIKKRTLITLLFLTLIFYFIPDLKINGITFTWIGFVLPLIFSVLILISIKNLKLFFKMFVVILISFSLGIVYNLITFDVYESAIFQPYLVLGILLGTLPLILCKTPQNLYASNFIGITLSEIIFYYSRYSIYGEYYLTIGSLKVFELLTVSFVSSLLAYFLYRKIKAVLLKRKSERKKQESYLA